MTVFYSTTEDIIAELTRACAQCGITVDEAGSAILYATAEDPRTALAGLQEYLFGHTAFRERSVQRGDEEAYVTVLDPIDRTTTIKIRRPLPG